MIRFALANAAVTAVTLAALTQRRTFQVNDGLLISGAFQGAPISQLVELPRSDQDRYGTSLEALGVLKL
jgi:hypothetical protein